MEVAQPARAKAIARRVDALNAEDPNGQVLELVTVLVQFTYDLIERLRRQSIREATKPASFNFLQQQERFDQFTTVYNEQRPHQALNGACPGDLYTPSPRAYEPPPDPEYPYHDRTVRVTRCGRICIKDRKINLSTVFAGQLVGIREVEDQTWLVSFLHYDLGFFDQDEGRVEPAPNPFTPERV